MSFTAQNLAKTLCLKKLSRTFSCSVKTRMKAWQCYRYGDLSNLEMSRTSRVPHVSDPSSVLIKVHAASVNPLDVMMLGGFGATLIGFLRKSNDVCARKTSPEFPVTFGRDFSGVVIESGKGAYFKPGDEVWGVIPSHGHGSHAEYVLCSKNNICRKPKNLSHVEAASIPYACVSALSALVVTANLKSSDMHEKRVLVIGGSGGIGTFAIQWLKSKGTSVTTVVSTDAVDMVTQLGADIVIDYKDKDFRYLLEDAGRFDVILDCVRRSNLNTDDMNHLLKLDYSSKYVTLTSPLLSNIDNSGLIAGTLKSLSRLGTENIKALQHGYTHRWSFATPTAKFLKDITLPVETKQIVPVIDKIFKFEDVPDAFSYVMSGHARGKTVISVMEEIDKPDTHLNIEK